MAWATGCPGARTATIARAAAVEVCEPRQGREAAALSIPSRRRGLTLDKSGSTSISPARCTSHDDFSRFFFRSVAVAATAGRAGSGGEWGLGILGLLPGA